MTRRAHAGAIFQAALTAADPKAEVLAHLSAEERMLHAGKASAPMAQGVEKVCGKRIAGGYVVVMDGHKPRMGSTERREIGRSVAAIMEGL